MGFEGRIVPECCSSFCDTEEANRNTVYPLLKKVVGTPFFSHFEIDLCSSCELWEDQPQCRMRDCSVCECEEPPVWSLEKNAGGSSDSTDSYRHGGVVVAAVDSAVLGGWETLAPAGPFGYGVHATSGGHGSGAEPTARVVDLLENPEGYTGYTGPSAEKVWSAVHSKNCFQTPNQNSSSSSNNNNNNNNNTIDEYCFLSPEQRLYNRFLSGLHSSISLHIAHLYCLEMDPERVGECAVWGPNDDIAYDRVLKHPGRVENLYVAFSLLLRAVVKAGSAVTAAVPDSDPLLEEGLSHWRESLLPELVSLERRAPPTFDETSLLAMLGSGGDGHGEDAAPGTADRRRSELRGRFEELESIIRCVGCDRCKLWGTLQTLGLGTALKILLDDDGSESLRLSRQEAVALVNTLERLSSSLVFAQEFRARREAACRDGR